ncbi:MAG TPA: hypothetical protein VJH03_09810 [Blastocatellia bacterium]|nr:hypothetical protein [Blastocatellia bacterium]
MNKTRVVALVSTIALLLDCTPFVAAQSAPRHSLTGFTRTSAARELKIESNLRDAIQPARIENALRRLTRDPHTAATPANNRLPEWVRDEWKAAGLEDVHFENYDVLLSYPKPGRVGIRRARSVERDGYDDGVRARARRDGARGVAARTNVDVRKLGRLHR